MFGRFINFKTVLNYVEFYLKAALNLKTIQHQPGFYISIIEAVENFNVIVMKQRSIKYYIFEIRTIFYIIKKECIVS